MFGFDALSALPFSGLPAAGANQYSITAQRGTYSLTGQSAILLRTKLITANNGTYALTGRSITLVRSRLLTATNGVYTLAGNSATITYTPAAISYTITALNGVYSVSGRTADITFSGAPAPVVAGQYFIEIRTFTDRRRI
jgi:hypothetical protein